MGISKLAIKRPVTMLMAALFIVVFGFVSLISTPITLIPAMDMPVIMISSSYPGAAPSEVESLVTQPLEDVLGTVGGLSSLQSISMEGACMVVLQYNFGTDMDEATSQIRDKLELAKNMLPDEASSPTMMKMNMDDQPIAVLSVTSGNIDDAYYTVKESVLPEFEKITGVASVSLSGGVEKTIAVEADEALMAQYGISLSSITSAISGSKINMPAGSIEVGQKQLLLRGEYTLSGPTDVANIAIPLPTGDVIRLGDVAKVYEKQMEKSSVSRINGQDNMSISIVKQQDANTLGISSSIIQTIARLNAQGLGVEIDVIMDQGEFISDSLSTVVSALLAGGFLAIFVLWFFLGDIKASLIIATSIPLSVIVTFILMFFADISINIISMGGLVVGVGMMVDNSIVVLESMFRCRSQGMTHLDAGEIGAKLVGSAVTASTMTTVVVFLPIVFMTGMSSELFSQAGLTIAFSLIASLVSAITLVPCMFVQLKPVEKGQILANKMMAKLESSYEKTIDYALTHRKTIVALAITASVVGIGMLPIIGAELMPTVDEGQFSVSIETEQGLLLNEMDNYLLQVEEIIRQLPEVESYTSSASGGGMNMMSGSVGSSANVSVYLTKDHKLTTEEVCALARKELTGILDCEITVAPSNSMMMSVSSNSATIYVQSKDENALAEAVQLTEAAIGNVAGIDSVSSDLRTGRPEARIEVDALAAASYGINPAFVISAVSQHVNGVTATKLDMGGEEISVKVTYGDDTYNSINQLYSMSLQTPQGLLVPLTDVAEITIGDGPLSITRIDSQRVITITANIVGRDYASVMGDISKITSTIALPSGASFYTGEGQIASMAQEFTTLGIAMLLSIVLVFMVMAAQFESMRFSIVVMVAVPLSVIGAIFGLLLTGNTINMTSIIGMIVLVGIVINNAIVLIDCVGQLRGQGVGVHDALKQAGHIRLRPILMTTLTTVLSLVPLSLGIGSGGEMMQPMAVVTMGGMISSTVLTLIVIPVLYFNSDRNTMRRQEKKLAKLEAKRKKRAAVEEQTFPKELDHYIDDSEPSDK